MPAGYSGTPLAKKLGIKAGAVVLLDGAPADYLPLLEPLPKNVTFARALGDRVEVIHLFTAKAAELAKKLRRYRDRMRADAALWVSWPKRSSKVKTDITEDVIRALALPMGLVDVKVCAVDEVWSGLKLVIRVDQRDSASLA
jgi:hypothetical protein